MLKVMGLKIWGIRGSFTVGVQRWAKGGKICRDIQLGAYISSEVCKLVVRSCFMVSIFVSMEECMFY
jgi:hypothetical protein